MSDVEHVPRRQTLRRALAQLRPHRRRVGLLSAMIVAGAALGVGAPLLTKLIFDDALFPRSGEPRLGLLVALVGGMIVLVAATAALAVLQTFVAAEIAQKAMHDLRAQLFAHMQRMSLRFFTTTPAGEIHSRLANDVSGLERVIAQSITGVANVAFLIASLVAMAILAWPLAVLTAVLFAIFLFATQRAGEKQAQVSREVQEALAELANTTQETLSVSGALLAKSFGSDDDTEARHRAVSDRVRRLRIRELMARRVVTGTAQAAFLAAPALVYLGAGVALAGGSTRYTAGTLVAFTALQIRTFVPVRELLATSLDLSSAASVYERVFAYLDLPHEITDAPDAKPLPASGERGRVELDHVSFGYDDRSLALDDVSLEVAPGQLAALVGPSGAGKTTITYLIARLYDVQGGAVRIDGLDVRDATLASLVEAVGSVTQDIYLLNASVADNLRVARPDATDEEIQHAARVACIHERITQFEHGYETLVGERGYRLSGGEKQRLAIARVILRDPRVLLLDEATSALDTASERLLQRALAPVLEHRTTIAIAHRLSTIVAADVIFVLEGGRIVERGTHAELLARGGVYARLYERQFAADGSPTSLAAATPARSAGDRSHMARP